MTLSPSVYEIRSAATSGNVNGGGFNPANANMLTDLTTTTNTGNTASPVVSSASYNFVAGDVGAWVYIKSGTNWTPGWYQIASVATNKATLSAAVGQAVQVSGDRYVANTVAGCATTGTPTAGTWTVDYSQQNSAQVAVTNLASTNGATNPSTVTSATYNFSQKDVGNFIHITAGTNWTQGWYEIVSVASNAATVDRAVGATGTLSGGTAKMGGALSLGSSDDDVFALATGSPPRTGSRVFIKGNATYTLSFTGTTTPGGTAQGPTVYEGYYLTRGDTPTDSTRPIFDCGATQFTMGIRTSIRNMIWTGTAANVLSFGDLGSVVNCKATNTSTTAGRVALRASAATGALIYQCEAISYRGYAFYSSSANLCIDSCWAHDSSTGISIYAGSATNNIVSSCTTTAIHSSSAAGVANMISNNTIYGAENQLGNGIDTAYLSGNYPAGAAFLIKNNIFYGCATGISVGGVYKGVWSDYNDFYNNSTDVTNVYKGANDLAVDPAFSNVTQITGSTATTSGSVLTQSGGDFSSVVPGQDFIYLKSGTGITAGIYGITATTTTTLTLDIAPGNSAVADKVWQITLGNNFAIGTNLAGLGFPGTFPAGLTTGYADIGAVPRLDAGETASTFVGG